MEESNMTEQQANLTDAQEKFAQALYDAYKSGKVSLLMTTRPIEYKIE